MRTNKDNSNCKISVRNAKYQSKNNSLLMSLIESPIQTTSTNNVYLFNTPSQKSEFTKELWDKSMDIANDALKSCFISGIAKGDLDPNDYGKYTIQDVIYCYRSTQNLKFLLQNPANNKYKKFIENRIASFESYTKTLFEQWNIANPDAIKLSEAAETYINYQELIFKHYNIIYAIVSMLPCEMLWTWLANKMQNNISEHNVYSFWIKENMGSEPGKIGDFLNQYSDHVDFDEALQIFLNCMRGEYNFFCSPCGQFNLVQDIDFKTFTPNVNYNCTIS